MTKAQMVNKLQPGQTHTDTEMIANPCLPLHGGWVNKYSKTDDHDLKISSLRNKFKNKVLNLHNNWHRHQGFKWTHLVSEGLLLKVVSMGEFLEKSPFCVKVKKVKRLKYGREHLPFTTATLYYEYRQQNRQDCE